MDLAAIVDQLVGELQALAQPERAVSEKAYLKSDLVHYGTSVPDCNKVAKSLRRRWPELTHDQLIGLCTVLWSGPSSGPSSGPVHEQRMLVVCTLRDQRARVSFDDLAWLERFIREAKTWALVDEIARHNVAELALCDERTLDVLDRWLLDEDFWIRRSAVIGLSKLVRVGRELDRFFRYADHLLPEREFFIRKVLGWVAREIGVRHPDQVGAWLRANSSRMNGVTIREAVKYLPDGADILAEWKAAGGGAQLTRRKRPG